MNKLLLTLLLVLPISLLHAQVMGHVYESKADGSQELLVGANVFWSGSTIGTVTDTNGHFALDRIESTSLLVISYVGYIADTIDTEGKTRFPIALYSNKELDEVVIQGSKATTAVNTLEGINTITMNEEELFKAACCNLSESFETNPSVDVSFTDAITGTKQIQMLGLTGSNTMIGFENMPGVRGIASNVGLSFVPGTWIQSIQVTKGVGSVVNGYEAIAGQINVELKKPQASEKLFLNVYGNQSGRSEMNANFTQIIGKRWGATVLLHGSIRPFENDNNEDGFLDFPKANQLNFINRWQYKGLNNNLMGQIGVKMMRDNKLGGQKGYDPEIHRNSSAFYGLELNTERYEVWGKLGYLNPKKPYQSIGLQLSGSAHNQDAYFGYNDYNAEQQTLYGNLIYQSIIGSTQHKYKTGLSLLYDNYNEEVAGVTYNREERVPGAFFEYTYDFLDKITVVAGLRADYHNLFGAFITPRLHTRFAITESTTFRASAGSGQRTANIFAENISLLASSRVMSFANLQTKKAYGFKQDKAWNFGFNVAQEFKLNYRPATLMVDFYHTFFENQVVVDIDTPGQVVFSGLDGESFSNSLQIELHSELARRFDIRLAYRYIDVQSEYIDGIDSKPLVAKNRAFVNLAYKTKKDWAFDFTTQWVGQQRLPDTSSSPEPYRLSEFSPDYAMLNAQVTKSFKNGLDVYLGGENLGNYKQENPIISHENPYGYYFDSSIVYAPIFGRMIYAGLRFKID